MKGNMTRCVCIIGARKGSKRLPGKNRLQLGGKPLYMHTLESAIGAELFDHIIFTTDDDVILSELGDYPKILLDQRPSEFAEDGVTMMEVLTYLFERYKDIFMDCKNICLLTPCTPLRNSKHICEAYKLYKKSGSMSLVSLTEFPCPPELALEMEDGWVQRKWEGAARPGEYKKRYYPNGCVIFSDYSYFAIHGNFYPPNTVGYLMTWPDCLDIDYEADYNIARMLVDKMGYSDSH